MPTKLTCGMCFPASVGKFSDIYYTTVYCSTFIYYWTMQVSSYPHTGRVHK